MSEQTTYVEKRIPVYPRSVKGTFRNIKTAILLLAYGVYFLLPWFPWQRPTGPNQTVLFDLVGRKFFIFDLTIYAQDIFWLAGFLIIGAFLLFYVTSLLGRVFCGYFCFQTLWTDVFLFIERLVQGERNARIKLAKADWSAQKASKLGMTWLLWIAVSVWTGVSFTLYWGDSAELVKQLVIGEAPFPAYATIMFLTVTTLVMAGLAREQVCTYMCPYARFQSAMFDQDTRVVAYDEKRGERECGACKPTKQNLPHEYRLDNKLGDCIDCGYCVQVCPVGIDIRNGLQYQCITCALCIDACDTVMKTINYPTGLIRYTSESEQRDDVKHQSPWLKLKNISYAIVLLGVTALLITSIVNRSPIELHVQQVRQPLYIILSDGFIQNRYQIKVSNKYETAREFKISVSGADHARLVVRPSKRFTIKAGDSLHLSARISIDPARINDEQQAFDFILEDVISQEKSIVNAQFFIPN